MCFSRYINNTVNFGSIRCGSTNGDSIVIFWLIKVVTTARVKLEREAAKLLKEEEDKKAAEEAAKPPPPPPPPGNNWHFSEKPPPKQARPQ